MPSIESASSIEHKCSLARPRQSSAALTPSAIMLNCSMRRLANSHEVASWKSSSTAPAAQKCDGLAQPGVLIGIAIKIWSLAEGPCLTSPLRIVIRRLLRVENHLDIAGKLNHLGRPNSGDNAIKVSYLDRVALVHMGTLSHKLIVHQDRAREATR